MKIEQRLLERLLWIIESRIKNEQLIYTVSRKKETDLFLFCNISYKTQVILMKFGTPFYE